MPKQKKSLPKKIEVRRPLVSDIFPRKSVKIRKEEIQKEEIELKPKEIPFEPRESYSLEKKIEEKISFIAKEAGPERQETRKPETRKIIEAYEKERPSDFGKFFRRFLTLTFIVAAGAGLLYLGLAVLPQATIKIYLKKYTLDFSEVFVASKNADADSGKLAVEIFSKQNNLQMRFPASGRKKIEKKAQGKVTLYNSYSSGSQYLVAKTRLLAPDNKVFLLIKPVTVPGAKIQEGKIVPSTIEAEVIAEKAGIEYNIGPVEKFTLPGFQGTAKERGFYAKSDQAFSGGFVGEIAVPTDKDIQEAKKKIRENLEDSLKTVILIQFPDGFKVPEGASKFEVLNEKIDNEGDQENQFGVFLEGKFKMFAFREKDLKNILINRLLPKLPEGDYEVKDLKVEYSSTSPDFEKNELSLTAKGQIIFQSKIDLSSFRQQLSGKTESEIKILVFSLPGLEKGAVSFWPKYVNKAPADINKIQIAVE